MQKTSSADAMAVSSTFERPSFSALATSTFPNNLGPCECGHEKPAELFPIDLIDQNYKAQLVERTHPKFGETSLIARAWLSSVAQSNIQGLYRMLTGTI